MTMLDLYTAGAPAGHRRRRVIISPDELPGYASLLFDRGFRVALVAGHHDADSADRLRAVYLFTAGDLDRRIELHVPLDRVDPHLPSLAGLSFPAGRFEREMRDLYGITPDDHPLPRRLVRHFHWPRGWYPMPVLRPRSAAPTAPTRSARWKDPGCTKFRSVRCMRA